MLLIALLWLQDVDALIARLGDDKPEVREQAMVDLRKIGKKALDPLRKATASGDAEIAERAKKLVDILDFPDPGPAVDGLAIALKAEAETSKKDDLLLRARLINTTDKDVIVGWGKRHELAPAYPPGGPSLFELACDGAKSRYWCCGMRDIRKSKRPLIPERVEIKKGEFYELTFSLRGWCASKEHGKCEPPASKLGKHKASLLYDLPSAAAGGWSGRVASNEVEFEIKE